MIDLKHDVEGRNESHKLSCGGELHLVKPPNAKWNIRFCEVGHHVGMDHAGERHLFSYRGPKEWSEREFDCPETAVAFVEGELQR